ncbi:MAG: hypothetical protein KBA95_01830 [Acidobacteria bacterium]|nr:hypothetical protein [Acidobacteriota bacterium]
MRRTLALVVVLLVTAAASALGQAPPVYRTLAEDTAREMGYPNRVSEAGAGQVTREVAARIYWTVGDKTIGLLKKRPSQTQYLGCGIDVLLHRPTGIVVDIITASGTAGSRVSWQVQDKAADPRYDDSYFVIPPKPATTPPTPDPPADPDPSASDVLTPRIVGLEQRAAGLEAQLAGQAAALAELTERLLALAQRVAVLEHAGPGGEIVCVEVEVETSRESWLPHRHKITVPLCKPKEP